GVTGTRLVVSRMEKVFYGSAPIEKCAFMSLSESERYKMGYVERLDEATRKNLRVLLTQKEEEKNDVQKVACLVWFMIFWNRVFVQYTKLNFLGKYLFINSDV